MLLIGFWNIVLLLSMTLPTSMVEFKIGVIVPTDIDLDRSILLTKLFTYTENNITVEINWELLDKNSLFNIVQAGTTLMNNGALIVFVIHFTPSQLETLDWLLPLTGIGQLPVQTETTRYNSCFPLTRGITFQDLLISDTEATQALTIDHFGILLTLVKTLKADNTILIYSDESEFIIRDISAKTQTNGTFLSMYKIDESYTNEQIYDLLRYFYESNTQSYLYVVVLSDSVVIKRLMTEADLFDAKRPRETALAYRSRWMVLNIDGSPVHDTINIQNLNNVALINLPKNNETLDLPEDMTLQFYLEAIGRGDVSNGISAENGCLNESSLIQLRSDIWNFSSQARKSCLSYVRLPVLSLMFNKNGRHWDKVGELMGNGDVKTISSIFPNVANGFNGKLFTLSTLEYSPYTYLVNGTWRGLCFELLVEMSKQLNFTYEIIQPEDGEWGALRNDSLWSGLIGQLQKREVDITVTPLAIQGVREEVMDFTMPFFFDVSVILMKKTDPRETQWRKLIEPLRWEVIVLTACFVPMVSLMLFFMEKKNPYYNHWSSRISLHDTFWYTYGCVFLQGGVKLPASQTGRTVVCCWWLFCIILSATYCGNLIAFLTVTKEKPPFDALNEMVNDKEFEWGTLGGTYWETWFKHSSIPTLEKVWSGMQKFNISDPRVLSTSATLHMQKVKEGKYAYIADKAYLEMKTSKDCDLYIAKEEFLPLQYGVGLPNYSPYTKIFSDTIIKIHDAGLLQVWKQQHWPKQNFCKGSLITEAKPIKWIDIQTAFYMLGAGFVFGSVVLGFEFIYKKLRNSEKTLALSLCNKRLK